MKTILCPIDFTPRGKKLINYVANLAKERNCKIYIIPTQSVKKKELAISGSPGRSNKLDELHDYFSETMGIPCGIVDESLSGNLYKKLGNVADHYDIMAMMIYASSSKEKVSDIRLKKIIQDTLAPILVVPDQFSYQPIRRLLYAYDYKHEREAPLMQLNWLAEWFDTEMVFVTLLPGDSSLREESKMNSIHSAIRHSWKGNHAISFETIVYPSLPKGFEHYLGLSQLNDLLVLSINHQNIMERIWHKRVVKGVLQISQHPYLIIHE
jgi:hypothetical protein